MPISISGEEKASLTRRILQVLSAWGVEPMEQGMLLGLPRKDAGRRFRRYRMGYSLPDDEEIWTRVALLLRIESATNQLFPHSALSANLWVTTPSPKFGGGTPLSFKLDKGLPGIQQVERGFASQDIF